MTAVHACLSRLEHVSISNHDNNYRYANPQTQCIIHNGTQANENMKNWAPSVQLLLLLYIQYRQRCRILTVHMLHHYCCQTTNCRFSCKNSLAAFTITVSAASTFYCILKSRIRTQTVSQIVLYFSSCFLLQYLQICYFSAGSIKPKLSRNEMNVILKASMRHLWKVEQLGFDCGRPEAVWMWLALPLSAHSVQYAAGIESVPEHLLCEEPSQLIIRNAGSKTNNRGADNIVIHNSMS